mgnify:CR=1 FL=1
MNRSVVFLLLLSLGASLGATLSHVATKNEAQQAIEWLDTPRSMEIFSLQTEAGVFNNHSLEGRWTLVVFGFLHCPEICPTSLSQLATLADSLAVENLDTEVSFVFVTVDPERDSLTDVSQYVRHFHSSIRGVSGEAQQLSQLAQGLGIQFMVSPDENSYSVSHSVTFSIIDAEGVFRGRFRPGFDVPNLVKNLTSKFN